MMQNTETCSLKLVTKYGSAVRIFLSLALAHENGTRYDWVHFLSHKELGFCLTSWSLLATRFTTPSTSACSSQSDNHAGQAPPPMEIEGQDNLEIETILQHRPPKNFAHAIDG